MILYDDYGQLLGADRDSIELFGCSDIEEFREKVANIADFFVEKEGYLYNFGSYNWIDFLNYSEENIHKVLIKQNDGSEIEAKVVIKEIYNVLEINGSKTTYLVDFIKSSEVSADTQTQPREDIQEVVEKNTLQDTLVEQEGVDDEILDLNISQDPIELETEEIGDEYEIDRDLYIELLNDFVLESKNDIELMSAYITKSNYELLLKTAKKLKNISTHLKLKSFLSILNSIEKSVQAKKYDEIEKLLELYKKEHELLKEKIRKM